LHGVHRSFRRHHDLLLEPATVKRPSVGTGVGTLANGDSSASDILSSSAISWSSSSSPLDSTFTASSNGRRLVTIAGRVAGPVVKINGAGAGAETGADGLGVKINGAGAGAGAEAGAGGPDVKINGVGAEAGALAPCLGGGVC
jgi:hypothetical protein